VHICACWDEGKHLHQYRRAEAGDTAGRLTDMLVRDKERVFVDVDMQPAVKWPDEIQKQ
jgi:hypothetical protein